MKEGLFNINCLKNSPKLMGNISDIWAIVHEQLHQRKKNGTVKVDAHDSP
jgi:hypothetical protein